MSRKNLTEAGAGTITAPIAEAGKTPKLRIQLITPGWGSSGYYSAKVLEAAAKAGAWPAGTQMYLDHSDAIERETRPERSVKDIAAVLTENAYWDGKAVVADADPVGAGRVYATDKAFLEAVGVSVSSMAEVEQGEAEGRKGWVVKEIYPDTFNSVDFVTHAGRGGRVMQLVESARKAEQVVEAGELDSDRREKFRDAVRDKYAADKVDVWVQDYDDTTVYFERWGGDDPGTFSQTYSETDDAIDLTGDLVKVRAKTTYVPVDEADRAPELTRETAIEQIREARNVGQWMESRIHLSFTQVADEMYGNAKLTREERISLSNGIGAALDAFTTVVEDKAPQLYSRDLWTDPEARVTAAESATPIVPRPPAGLLSTTTQESQEDTMTDNEGATTSITESKRRELEEAAGRVPVLEAKLVSETERADTAEQALAVEKARDYARDFGTKRVNEANSELPHAVVAKIVAEAMRDIPLTEADKAADRRLDTDAFSVKVDEAQKTEETYLASIVESGNGRVRGVGSTGAKAEVTEAQVNNIVAGAFGRTVKEA